MAAGGSGDRKLADRSARGDPPDLVTAQLGEPEVAVRAGRDPIWAAGRCGDRKLADLAARGDSPDLVDGILGEPDVPIGARRDLVGAAGRCGDRKLADLAARGDSPDLVDGILREPEVPLGPAAIPSGRLFTVGIGNSLIAPVRPPAAPGAHKSVIATDTHTANVPTRPRTRTPPQAPSSFGSAITILTLPAPQSFASRT